jgi:hypothetical protein
MYLPKSGIPMQLDTINRFPCGGFDGPASDILPARPARTQTLSNDEYIRLDGEVSGLPLTTRAIVVAIVRLYCESFCRHIDCHRVEYIRYALGVTG